MSNRNDMPLELAGGLLLLALGLLYGGVLAPLDGWITPREQILTGATVTIGLTLSMHAGIRLARRALQRLRDHRRAR